jgi:hypothetical protein
VADGEGVSVVEYLEYTAEMREQRVVQLRDRYVLVGQTDGRQLLAALKTDIAPVLDAICQRYRSRRPEDLIAREVVARPLRPPPFFELVAVCGDGELVRQPYKRTAYL